MYRIAVPPEHLPRVQSIRELREVADGLGQTDNPNRFFLRLSAEAAAASLCLICLHGTPADDPLWPQVKGYHRVLLDTETNKFVFYHPGEIQRRTT